jgi:type IV pilus assembly protein PilY1
MKPELPLRSTSKRPLLALAIALAAGLALPLPALAAAVELATAPLATSTTSTVKPNLLLMFDNSGSMDWDHMPDDSADGGSSVSFVYGYYGVRSPQCNQVYFDPTITYYPPVHPDTTSYANASFSGAWTNGFKTSSGTDDLRTGFKANQSGLGGNAGGTDSGEAAYYYNYSGSQLSQLQKNYNSTSNTFYNECRSARYASPGADVFTKISLSATAATTTATIVISGSSSTSVSGILLNGIQIMSGTAAASTSPATLATNIATKINDCRSAKTGSCTSPSTGHGYTAAVSGSTVTLTGLEATASSLITTQSGSMTIARTIYPAANATTIQNFANWYSYYRNRLLMMKTATGRAFSNVNKNYRVGFAKISSSSTPTVYVDTFWDNSDSVAGPVSTQRTTWYNALYNTTTSGSTPLRTALSDAGRYYAGKLAGADPLQYSCQQNFTLLSTDGYWNAGDGYKLDGSTAVGNQDGTAPRPMYDGAQATSTWTFTYTRDSYSKVSTGCPSSGWGWNIVQYKQIKTQPQIGTCTKSSGTGSCTPTNWVSDGPSTLSGDCSSTNPPYPGGNSTTAPVLQGSPVATAGTSGGTSDNLADIAMYYYQTDLRTPELGNCGPGTTGPLCANNVFQGATDKNLQQHMTTFTLGLGASGWMNYSSSYLTDTTGDFAAVKLGSTADSSASPPVCSWQTTGTVCNWPVPGLSGSNGFIANIDDLWHAAVNGRGAYFSATNPTTLATGLSNALASINSKIGAAAAAATSTLNPVAGNNYAYVASYTTVSWKGNLEARGINVDTGIVSENASWCIEDVPAQSCAPPGSVESETSGAVTAFYCVTPNSVICNGGELVGSDCKVPVATACTGTMNTMVSDASDTRRIYTADNANAAATPPLIAFDAAYATANPASFSSAQISTIAQWASLTAAQRTAAAGVNLIKYLRGQNGHEFDRTANALVDQLYRKREAVLGDALESQPAFIGAPVFSYPYPGYQAYADANAGRAGTVYMGTNDGMMHAFAADTGVERWAYVPSMVVPNMWKLADTAYAANHTNYVNGSAVTSDVCVANCGNAGTAVWKTILVGGLNGGGRGYYALDITDPVNPVLLWEFKANDANTARPQDADLGYTFGRAVITRKTDGTWVVLVTSGYDNGTVSGKAGVNNSPAGSGIGYLYVLNAATGAVISKISTATGSATSPSGLAKIAGWNNEPTGNATGYLYGGDLLGNLWRFDINAASVMKFATLKDGSGAAQPIMTTPVLGDINHKRVVFIGTGKYLETSDLTTNQQQTQYAIKDDDETATLLNPRAVLVQQYLIPNPDGTATRLSSGSSATGAAVATKAVDFFAGRGWFVDFPDSGERVNIDARLVQGTLLVPSIVPSSTVCSPGGYGWLNFFDYKTGGAIAPIPGIPMASTKYDATIVGVNVLFIQGSPIVEVVTSTNPTPKKDPDVQFRAAAAGFVGKRQNWRELIP